MLKTLKGCHLSTEWILSKIGPTKNNKKSICQNQHLIQFLITLVSANTKGSLRFCSFRWAQTANVHGVFAHFDDHKHQALMAFLIIKVRTNSCCPWRFCSFWWAQTPGAHGVFAHFDEHKHQALMAFLLILMMKPIQNLLWCLRLWHPLSIFIDLYKKSIKFNQNVLKTLEWCHFSTGWILYKIGQAKNDTPYTFWAYLLKKYTFV